MIAQEPAATSVRRRRALAAGAIGFGLVLLTLLVIRHGRDESSTVGESGGNPILGLLAWIPATDETRAAFAVWTPDPGLAATPTASDLLNLATQLGVQPELRVVGATGSFLERYGWGLNQVSGWAVAGENGGMTVLDGQFDSDVIAERLEASGYAHASYRGAALYIGSTAGDPLNAIAVLDGRLIVSDRDVLVRQAIDVVVDGEGSLADEPVIAAMARAMAPLSGLVALDQSQQAEQCAPDRVFVGQSLTGRYVAIGYGRQGEGGERRTLVATSYADEPATIVALANAELDWRTGEVSAAGVGARIEDIARFTGVAQAGRVLVAELLEGRIEGWAPVGIRFASPVCEAALTGVDQATPEPAATGEPSMARLVASLPEIAADGEFRALDLAAIAAVTGVAAPVSVVDGGAVSEWLQSLGPRPAMAIAPLTPSALTAWATAFATSPSAINGVAETRLEADAEPIGVLIGDWRLDVITNALVDGGYDWIDLDGARHFAPKLAAGGVTNLTSLAGGAWENIAIAGDQLWFSADQRAMRAAIAEVDQGAAPSSLRAELIAQVAGATAVEIAGADAFRARGCGALLRDVMAFGAFWSAGEESDGAAIAYLLAPAASVPPIVDLLEQRALAATLRVARPTSGTPTGDETRMGELFGYLGAASASTPVGDIVLARFSVPEAARLVGPRFFDATIGRCWFVTVA